MGVNTCEFKNILNQLFCSLSVELEEESAVKNMVLGKRVRTKILLMIVLTFSRDR